MVNSGAQPAGGSARFRSTHGSVQSLCAGVIVKYATAGIAGPERAH